MLGRLGPADSGAMNDAHLTRHQPSVEELVGSCLDGEETAFRRLVERLLPDAMTLAIQFVRRRDLAEDVVQEAFLRLARALPTYDRRRPFEPWFFTIVRNCARDRSLQNLRWDRHEDAGNLAAEVAVEHRDGAGLAVDLGRALGGLPAMQQRCVRLCLFEGYTSAEAAGLLGVREGTVRTHVQRARKRLRSTFGEGEAS